jgi:hypothetical protein
MQFCFDFSCSCASVVLDAGDLGSAVFPFWPPLCLACALGSTVSAHHFHFHAANLSSGVGLRFSTLSVCLLLCARPGRSTGPLIRFSCLHRQYSAPGASSSTSEFLRSPATVWPRHLPQLLLSDFLWQFFSCCL